jgi:hypothetical protein
MATDIAEAMKAFLAFIDPRDGLGDSPFRLGCSFDTPASDAEIASAWPGRELPRELLQVWAISRQSRLFEDMDYGQWGLVLLSPTVAAHRTAEERAQRPNSYRADDVVIGEFLGDQELLILAPSEDRSGCVLVALPLDDRRDWHVAASDLADFLKHYLNALGNKFWK